MVELKTNDELHPEKKTTEQNKELDVGDNDDENDENDDNDDIGLETEGNSCLDNDLTVSESQIVIESDESDGEYLVYTAKRLQVCISRNHERNSTQCKNKARKSDLKLESALLGNPSVVWTPEADFSITDPCISPCPLDPPPVKINPDDDDFSDCTVCNGYGKRPSRRKKLKFKRKWCPQCRIFPLNDGGQVQETNVKVVNSVSNETLGCKPVKISSSKSQGPKFSIFGYPVYPENSYIVYVPDLLSEITIKGSCLLPGDPSSMKNPQTFIVLIEGNKHEGTRLRPLTSPLPNKVPAKVGGSEIDPAAYYTILVPGYDQRVRGRDLKPLSVGPDGEVISANILINGNTLTGTNVRKAEYPITTDPGKPEPTDEESPGNDQVQATNYNENPGRPVQPSPCVVQTAPENKEVPDLVPKENRLCSALKETRLQNCTSGSYENCTSIHRALRDPPPSSYQGVDILPNRHYTAHIPDLGIDLQVSGLDLRSNPNDADLENPSTILVMTKDKVYVGTTIANSPVICLGVPIDPDEFYDVFVPDFGTTVRVPGTDLSPGADGSTVLVKFKDRILCGTAVSPRDSAGTSAKNVYKKVDKPKTKGKPFPNKVSEQLFGKLGLPLLASSSSTLDGPTPYPFGGLPDSSDDPSTMELDHLPSCKENNPGVINPPVYYDNPTHRDEDPLNHCPNCSCFRDSRRPPSRDEEGGKNEGSSENSPPKKLFVGGHLHCQQCIAPGSTTQPDNAAGDPTPDAPADRQTVTSPVPVMTSSNKPTVRWGGPEAGGFSISTMYGPVPIEPEPVPEQGARKPRCRKRTSPPPPCKTNFNLVPEIAGCPEQVEIEEPGMRDNSGYPLLGPDREIILTCGHIHKPACYFVRRV
ncbi:hypothetical protein ACHWQZ_G019354 [Mnemiopsis leidyi]